jgi:IS5 family transposase
MLTCNLFHTEEQRVFFGECYLGIQKWDEFKDCKKVSWVITTRPDIGKKMHERKLKAQELKRSAKVEHSFRYIKQSFGCSKFRYRDLAKI